MIHFHFSFFQHNMLGGPEKTSTLKNFIARRILDELEWIKFCVIAERLKYFCKLFLRFYGHWKYRWVRLYKNSLVAKCLKRRKTFYQIMRNSSNRTIKRRKCNSLRVRESYALLLPCDLKSSVFVSNSISYQSWGTLNAVVAYWSMWWDLLRFHHAF